MEKTRKILSISTIVGVVLCAAMLIASLFGLNFFSGVLADILITTAALTIGMFFAISSIDLVKLNKIIAYVSLGLITGAVFLIILNNWVNFGEVLSQITFVIAILSVLFNIIVSGVLKLQKRYLWLQIIVYLVLTAFFVLLNGYIFGFADFGDTLRLFIVLLILGLLGLIIISVLSKKAVVVDDEKTNDKYVKISKEEYTELLMKAKQLDDMLNKQQ